MKQHNTYNYLKGKYHAKERTKAIQLQLVIRSQDTAGIMRYV
jgi:hypothetical protein